MSEKELLFPQSDEQLHQLWCSCFPEDADGYCDFFLNRWFRPDRCLVIREGENLQSMVHLFGAELLNRGSSCGRFLYLYAAGTAHEYRGRGNLGRLLEGCRELAIRRGFSGILLTSAEGLESLYEHYGMKRCAVRYETHLELQPSEPLPWETCEYERYSALRREHLNGMPWAFAWEPETDRFIYEVQRDSGAVMQWMESGESYYAVTGCEEDMPTLLESNHPLDEAFLCRLAASMGRISGMKVCSAKPINSTSEPVCFGHWLTTEIETEPHSPAYLNLIAD